MWILKKAFIVKVEYYLYDDEDTFLVIEESIEAAMKAFQDSAVNAKIISVKTLPYVIITRKEHA